METGTPESRFERLSRGFEVPMQVLAIAFVATMAIETVGSPSEQLSRVLSAVEWVIWAAFVAEYAILLWHAPDRRFFLRARWLDLVVIVAPALRVLRLARLVRGARLLRVVPVAAATLGGFRRVLGRKTVAALFVVSGLLALGAGAAVRVAEDGAGSGFESWSAALWWSVTTITTVGYGDLSPKTALGRGIALVLMLVGIALYGAITASLAALFVEADSKEDDLLVEIRALRAEVRDLRATPPGGDERPAV